MKATDNLYLDVLTTPPLPSSSPAPGDMMEMSPLPHKAPFSVTTEMDLESPTGEVSMSKSKQFRIPNSLQESPIEPRRPTE